MSYPTKFKNIFLIWLSTLHYGNFSPPFSFSQFSHHSLPLLTCLFRLLWTVRYVCAEHSVEETNFQWEDLDKSAAWRS